MRRSFTYLIRKDLNNEWEEGRKEEERSSISKTHTHTCSTVVDCEILS